MYNIVNSSIFLTSSKMTYSDENKPTIGPWKTASAIEIAIASTKHMENIFLIVHLSSINLFAPFKCPVTMHNPFIIGEANR